MDSIRVSEAPDPGSIPGEATTFLYRYTEIEFSFLYINLSGVIGKSLTLLPVA